MSRSHIQAESPSSIASTSPFLRDPHSPSSGRTAQGKTTLAKLLCRLYDPQSGAIEVDGVDLRELSLDAWRARVTAVFQDFTRFELPLRDNIAPAGAPDAVVNKALIAAGAANLAALDTVLARGYDGGTDLSGGSGSASPWRVPCARSRWARAWCSSTNRRRSSTFEEKAEIFERILAATRGRTTILISHRFSTVRQADRICVLEKGRVIELGTHDELMAAGGRYKTMFDLQAQRFAEDEEGTAYDVLG
jgi:ABC-type multidrug transport system fused ATPase/permease subunit